MMPNRPTGFALLIVVIAIAIMMLLYVIQMDTLFKPQAPAKPVEIEKRPWVYESLLAGPDQIVKKPKVPQPLLTEDFQIAGPADRKGQPRGQVKIAFAADGRLTAEWQCEYTAEGTTHHLSAGMAGNVCPKMTYDSAQGPDETRLFFIAKGDYLHTKQTPGAADSREKGTAWLTGWLTPDRTAEGFVTISTDLKWYMEFAFKAAP